MKTETAAGLDALLPSILDKASVGFAHSRSLRPSGLETTQSRLTANLAGTVRHLLAA